MSMQVVLAGLFPPRGTAMEWNRRLNWQPIPIFSETLDDDTVRKIDYIVHCYTVWTNIRFCFLIVVLACSQTMSTVS